MNATLTGLLEDQAARRPDAVAVRFEGNGITYARLHDRADALARSLAAEGAGPGRVVAVHLERSIELVVALVAILKTGAAYLPVEPGTPADRLESMLSEADPVRLVDRATALPPAPDTALTAPDPADAAYVIYTSGSTGRPKGVVVPHEAIVNRLLWMQAEYGLRTDDRVLQKTPVGFDVSVWEFFWPLSTGAILVMARPGGHREPGYLAEVIDAERITTLHFVPSMLREFLSPAAAARCSGLHRVICSGEALPVALRDRFHELMNAELHNLYGPTEAAVDVTAWRCVPGRDPATVPIGRPVWNTTAHVLDERLRPLPPDEPGELYLGGVQLARGYLARPALTAERFVADPVGPPGSRLYRTGDLVRRRQDGALEYVGRADRQVKIRGVRVEPGEIENVMAAHPEVVQAAVLLHDGRLVGYAVGTWREDELREHLRARLPEHMVPAVFVRMAEFPLSPNGKLNTKALAPPAMAPSGEGGTPGQPDEALLAQVVGQVLGMAGVGTNDRFIALGGDSISAMRVVRHALAGGLRLTTADVLETGTIAELAARAGQNGTANGAANGTAGGMANGAAPADVHDEGLGEIPPTPIMHWLRERGGPADSFSQSMVLLAPEDADLERLGACLRRLAAAHGALRARLDPATWTLHVPERVPPVEVTRVDATAVPDDRLPRLVCGHLEQARERLSPRDGVMFQAVWFDRGNKQGRLALVVHHLVVDGVSWHILRSDLEDAWKGRPLAPVPTSFRAWSRLLAEEALSPWRAIELHWWAARSPATTGGGEPASGSLSLTLSRERTTALIDAARTTFESNLQTLLLAALAQASPEEQIIDVEGHGREEIREGLDLTRTVGWFTSLFPVRLAETEPGDLPGAVEEVENELSQLPGRGLGYGLLRYLNPAGARRLAGRGTPELGFNYLGRFPVGGGEDWSLDPEHDVAIDAADPRRPAAHAIEVEAVVHDGPEGPLLSATWTWAGAGSQAKAAALAGRWRSMLAAFAAYDGDPAGSELSSMLTLGEADLRKIRDELQSH